MRDKRLSRSQIEYLNTEIKNLGAGDFAAVLSYYGIAVKKHSILCPINGHNDSHYGSCIIRKDGRSAFCYVCQKSIDAVQVVMERECMNYPDAMEYLWCRILGNFLPEESEDDKKYRPPLNYKELKFIGLEYCNGNEILNPYNICQKGDEGSDRIMNVDDFGICVVAKPMQAQSFFRLYETDRDAAMYIMQGKCRETIDKYKNMRAQIDDPTTPIGSLITNQVDHDEALESVNRNLKKAFSIQKKLRSH